MVKGLSFFLAFFLVLIPFSVFAERLSTSYLSMDIPSGWKCFSDGPNWVCHNKSKKLAAEALIVLTAKEKGPADSVSHYMAELKKRRPHTTKRGQKLVSKVIHSKQRSIKGHLWADGFHLERELFKYYSRYIGSTKKSLAVMVTYSAHKKKWKQYAADFNKSIASLTLLNVDKGLRQVRSARSKGLYGSGIQDYIAGLVGDSSLEGDEQEGMGMAEWMGENIGTLLGGAAGLGGLGFFWLKKLRRKGVSRPNVVSSRRRRKRR